jgi:excisionase family DNA binding protein
MQKHRDDLGPLYTISEQELSRPSRRREDRDVLVLRIEIEAQRREVARLTSLLRAREPQTRQLASAELSPEKVLLSARDVRSALGISRGTLYRWIQLGTFPPQIHLGSMSRWRKSDVDAWLHRTAGSGVESGHASRRRRPLRGRGESQP